MDEIELEYVFNWLEGKVKCVNRVARMKTKGPCWEWQSLIMNAGYGNCSPRFGDRLIHRAVFKKVYGDIPKGLEICHECDNKICCNPRHLHLGTRKENMKEACVRLGFNQKLSNADVAIIMARLRVGEGRLKISVEYGVTRAAIAYIARGDIRKYSGVAPLTLEERARLNDPELNPRTKLTTPKVLEIKKSLRAGESRRLLGIRYAVCTQTIDDIANNRTWSRVRFPEDE